MPQIIEETILLDELETVFYPKIRNSVFHFTSIEKLEKILEDQVIFPSGKREDIKTTSIYSEESMGRALGAVCLFDLRNKTDEQVAPGKSYYDFLRGKKGTSLIYLVLKEELYNEVLTLGNIEESLQKTKMYLPEI